MPIIREVLNCKLPAFLLKKVFFESKIINIRIYPSKNFKVRELWDHLFFYVLIPMLAFGCDGGNRKMVKSQIDTDLPDVVVIFLDDLEYGD